jgi:hypothetical protein
MSKLTAAEIEEIIRKAEENRRQIEDLKDKLHQAHLETATEKARADRMEKDSKKLYPTLPSDTDQADSATAADPSKGWQPSDLASGGGDQVTNGPVWSLAAAPGSALAPAYLTQSMQKPEKFKVGDDVEMFLQRFEDYCNGIQLPNDLRASRLLSNLDNKVYKVLSVELGDRRSDLRIVVDHLKKRYGTTQHADHLRFRFKDERQDEGETLKNITPKSLIKV